MPATITPTYTIAKAADILGKRMPEVAAMTQDGTLEIVEDGTATLRVSQFSVHRLWVEQGMAELRAEGIR